MNEKNKKKQAKPIETGNKKIAVVRIRSAIMQSKKIENTFTKLKLMRPNYCVIVPNTATYMGMLNKVKHIITWGELDSETEKLLEAKRDKGKKVIRLHPPRGGFERKGIKVPFKLGGAGGYRGAEINKLLKRML